ncbi:MAG: DUF4062 domain-containing protein [Chloroflexi bacterium]|nr:DUF4062 domain-containing protein [Chloroflexota bacterium]
MTEIYVSSTYSDLVEHRQQVYDILRKMRYDVIAMEDYVATDTDALWDLEMIRAAGIEGLEPVFELLEGYVGEGTDITIANPRNLQHEC